MLSEGAPIDGFGVGTRMGTSADAPKIDMAYKLVEYAGQGRLKLSSGKQILPGAKQVWRHRDADGHDHPRCARPGRGGRARRSAPARDHDGRGRAPARSTRPQLAGAGPRAMPRGPRRAAPSACTPSRAATAPEPLPVERSEPLLAHRDRPGARPRARSEVQERAPVRLSAPADGDPQQPGALFISGDEECSCRSSARRADQRVRPRPVSHSCQVIRDRHARRGSPTRLTGSQLGDRDQRQIGRGW